MNRSDFSTHILNWYEQNKRDLPWRREKDPYKIWISEVMLQQTRVETVIPYYLRWMELFPTIFDLSQASQQEVLAVWEGLGYYSRARNLHRAAEIVVQDMDGRIPSDIIDLRKLPGIGRYTASAIASIAYGEDEPTLDANIGRVLSRVFNVTAPSQSSQGKNILWKLAAANLPKGQAGEYNQALMELGATICSPHAPHCQSCPVNSFCQAYALGVQGERPVLRVKPAIPHLTVTAAVIIRDNRVLIAQRPPKGLLGGLWEFPGGKVQPDEDLIECLKREIEEEIGVNIEVERHLGVYRHAYTHFRVTLHAYLCSTSNGKDPKPIQVRDLRWVNHEELSGYPMGKLDRQISKAISSLEETC